MSTQLQSAQIKSNNPWDELLAFKDENQEIDHDAQILMFKFLSEIEKLQTIRKITRKKLAEDVNLSSSYLTQLYRGNKPLNFNTIARIQKALNISFKVEAIPTFNNLINEYNQVKINYTSKTRYSLPSSDFTNKPMVSIKRPVSDLIMDNETGTYMMGVNSSAKSVKVG